MGPTSVFHQPLHGKSQCNFVSVNLPVSLMELDRIGWIMDVPVRLFKSLQDLLSLSKTSWNIFLLDFHGVCSKS